jgi:hypothetical protein
MIFRGALLQRDKDHRDKEGQGRRGLMLAE